MEVEQPSQASSKEAIEGLDTGSQSWGDTLYPIDALLVRNESRTVFDVVRRIRQKHYIMDPEFQRDLVWDTDKQSKLIESVIMRIPLPVFYFAEDDKGRMVILDGLQRLTTFQMFTNDELQLKLPGRTDLHAKRFSDLSPKLQNRVEDCNLTFYILDSKVPERARLDIFERVNGGVPLTRQQMRNCLFMGKATSFLKREVNTKIFRDATGRSLNSKTMRDREFVNRFCAFQLFRTTDYQGDMDDFLARCLRKMNAMHRDDLTNLSNELRRGLYNNLYLFGRHAFRKHGLNPDQKRRSVLNASFWDVMSTGLSRYSNELIHTRAKPLRTAVQRLLKDNEFTSAITYGPNSTKNVRLRFQMSRQIFSEVLGANKN